MARGFVRKAFYLALILLGVSILCFALLRLSGRDPALAVALRAQSASEENIARLRKELGLTGTPVQQYLRWLSGFVRGDFGYSIYSGRSVALDIAEKLPVTCALMGLALGWILLLGTPVALCAAYRPGKMFDQIGRVLSILAICVPTFWLSYMLLVIFAVKIPLITVVPRPGLEGLLMPSLALAIPSAGSYVRVFRASLLRQMGSEYCLVARTRGLNRRQILLSHALRNALPPAADAVCGIFVYGQRAGRERVFAEWIGVVHPELRVGLRRLGAGGVPDAGGVRLRCVQYAGRGHQHPAVPVDREEGHMSVFRRLFRNPQAAVGFAMIVLLLLAAVLAPLLAPNDPYEQDLLHKYSEASSQYPLGTDQLGRCVLSRLIYGARYSLGISLPVVALLGTIGIVAGCFSACAPRAVQMALRYVCDVFIAFPAVVLAAALTGVAGNGVATLLASIVVSMWAWFVRMAAAYARVEMGKGYALASRIAGCGTSRLVFKHILPNILPQYIVYLSTGVASMIIMVSGFAFLGLGFTAGTPEWGAMLNEARKSLYAHPELLVYPGVCIAATAAAFNLFGEALRDVLERGEAR